MSFFNRTVGAAPSGGGEVVTVGVPHYRDTLQSPHTTPTRELAEQYAAALADPSHNGLMRCRDLAPDLRRSLMADAARDREAFTSMDSHLRLIESFDPRAVGRAIKQVESKKADLELEIARLRVKLDDTTKRLTTERDKIAAADISRMNLVSLAGQRPAAAFALQDRLRAAGVAVSLPEL